MKLVCVLGGSVAVLAGVIALGAGASALTANKMSQLCGVSFARAWAAVDLPSAKRVRLGTCVPRSFGTRRRLP